MKYPKKPLSVEQQAEKLLARGLMGDKSEIIDFLNKVNYYKLSGYTFPFKNKETDFFIEGTTFKEIVDIYNFDKKLRLLLFESIKILEICFRMKFTYHFTRKYDDGFAYINKNNLPKLRKDQHTRILKYLSSDYLLNVKKTSEIYVKHFFATYGDNHDFLPLWMGVELLSFGNLNLLYGGFTNELKSEIAKEFGVHHKVLISWLNSLRTVRNMCAHYSRVWNRELGIKPLLPDKSKYWKELRGSCNNRIFIIVLIINYLLMKINSKFDFFDKVKKLFDDFPCIDIGKMGFMDDWKDKIEDLNR